VRGLRMSGSRWGDSRVGVGVGDSQVGDSWVGGSWVGGPRVGGPHVGVSGVGVGSRSRGGGRPGRSPGPRFHPSAWVVCGPCFLAAWAAWGGSPIPHPGPQAVLGVWSAWASMTAGTQLRCCGWRFQATTGPVCALRVLCLPGVRASVSHGVVR